MPRKRGPKLNQIGDVSKFMARMIREVYMDKLDHAKAGRLAYMCNILKGCLEASDIEKRLEALETTLSVNR